MRRFLTEMRRRRLVRWIVAYLGGGWLTLEVVDTLGGLWSWPPSVGRVVFVLVSAGFIGAVVVGWYHGEGGQQRITTPEVLLLCCAVLAGAVGVAWVVRHPAGPVTPSGGASTSPTVAADPRALAVLPFADLSPGGNREYLGDGIAETLINNLARIPGLRVVARTSAFQFKEAEMDVPAIADRLGVGSVLEGTVTQVGTRVRITADLMDGRTGVARWAQHFDREMDASDLFALQDDVARKIVQALQVQLGGGGPIVRGGSRVEEAQEAYFRGLHHWTLRTTQDMVLAARYFNEAIAADSAYADAWAGLALTYLLFVPSEYDVPGVSAADALRKAEAAARTAIRLDSSSAAAYTALGDIDRQRGQLDGAERSFRKAITLNPGYATAHHWLADLYMLSFRGEDALREIDIAASLDPVAPAILGEKTEALVMLGRYAEARTFLEHMFGVQPDSPLLQAWGALFLMTMDDWDQAAEHLARVFELEGDQSAAADLPSRMGDPDRREALLQLVADGHLSEAGFPGDWDASRRFVFRLVAIRKVRGDEEAMAFLEREASGPAVGSIYLPELPALMGPDLSASARARGLMESLVRAQAAAVER